MTTEGGKFVGPAAAAEALVERLTLELADYMRPGVPRAEHNSAQHYLVQHELVVMRELLGVDDVTFYKAVARALEKQIEAFKNGSQK